MTRLLTTTLSALMTAAVATAHATTRVDVPLPSFELLASDGTRLDSRELRLQDSWVLIYVRPGCEPCDAMIGMFGKDAPPLALDRVVVVIGGLPSGDITRFSARWPELAGAQWYADPAEQAFSRLQLSGAPAMLGLRASGIAWTRMGQPSGADEMRSVIRSWLR